MSKRSKKESEREGGGREGDGKDSKIKKIKKGHHMHLHLGH